MAFTNEGYSWFQVAELSYDSFMISSFAQLIDAQDHTAPEQGYRGRHLVLLYSRVFVVLLQSLFFGRLIEVQRRRFELGDLDLYFVRIDGRCGALVVHHHRGEQDHQ